MEQWEYKTLKFKTGGFLGGKIDEYEFQEELNSHGEEGWSLFLALIPVNHKVLLEISLLFLSEGKWLENCSENFKDLFN